MNAAHLHIVLVHFPVILVPLGALLLTLGIWRNNQTLRTTAYCFFVGGALIGGPAFLLGEDAEELVEHLAGVIESNIEAHEEASEIAIWLTSALGVFSIVALLADRLRPAFARRFPVPLVALALVSAATLGYAAQLGGMIRHPEAFDAPGVGNTSGHEADDD